jgi:N-acyl-phosphatidylethanolamine-hydrolysing phospholipase D
MTNLSKNVDRQGLTDVATMIYRVQAKAPSSAELEESAKRHIPTMSPTFGIDIAEQSECSVKVTFLGHACFLLEYPSEKPGARGVRVLLDPVFSERCSPSKWVGPLRYTKAPCTVHDLPQIDAVVISHNHYDRTFLKMETPARNT